MDGSALRYKAARKAIRFLDRTIDRILTVLFLIVFLIGVWFAYDSYYVFNGASLESMKSFKPADAQEAGSLQRLSRDAICWITLYGSGIDYPIMQGEDNSEYLNKNPYGEYSLAGSIFMDFRCDSEFLDDYTLIYGHHMSGGYMFGALDDFADPAYFDSHRQGSLVTAGGREYDVETLAFVHTDASESIVFNPLAEGDRMQWMRQYASVLREPSREGGRLVALTTCKSPTSTLRTVVFVMIFEKEGGQS